MTAMDVKQIDVPRLAAVLEGIEDIEYAMIFGSARDGIVHAGSDLDVAVWLAQANGPTIDRLAQIVGAIEDAFAVSCDLVWSS